MFKALKLVSIGSLMPIFVGLFSFSTLAAEAVPKRLTKAPTLSQDRQVVDAMRKLGFAVNSAKRWGNSSWEVSVSGFDWSRADESSRGAILAPAASTGGMCSTAAARDMGISGRGGPLGPRGGGSKEGEQDGSATGGGNSGPDTSTGGGRDGGPLPGNDRNEGGSATGGGKDGGPENGTNPHHQGAVLKVSVAADGTLVVDANSLRKAGYTNVLGSTANGRVVFR